MTSRHRQSETDDLLRQGNQNLHEANSISTATVLTAIVSIAALLFSAISLYQTVLKQANLSVFVPEVVSYTRDPNGGYDVVVIPISIVNSGAFEFELTAQMQAVDTIDFVDRFAVSKIAPIAFTATLPPVPPYFDGQMMSGQSVRLFGQRN